MKVYEILKNFAKRITGEVPTTVLEKRGMKVGTEFNRQQGCYIDPTHCFLIEIGNNVTFSVRVTVLAHDASTKKVLNYTKIGKVKIGNNVFVGANTTILPDVVIGDNSIVGANTVVTKSIPAGYVVAGNPAKIICTTEEFLQKNTVKMNNTKCFGKEYRFSSKLSAEKIEEIRNAVQAGMAYID
jgi:hypothetical protein